MNTLFPIFQSDVTAPADLPVCREVAWDFERNRPLFRAGEPVMVQRAEAVLVWAWKALQTSRYRHLLYTWDYGNEVERLVGQPYSAETKRAEAQRYVEETLAPNPYITAVRDIAVDFQEDRLTIACTIDTIYGTASLGGVDVATG